MNYLEKVSEFHRTFGAPILEQPVVIAKERAQLRIDLIQEELNELKESVDNDDLVEVADALADLQYVLSGAILEFGMKEKFNEIFQEVHDSNMSKVCNGLDVCKATQEHYLSKGVDTYYNVIGNNLYIVYRSSDHKVLKSINYKPADIKPILNI